MRLLAPTLLALCLLAACGDRAVPATAQLTCTDSAECPTGWTCRPSIGRCVPPDLATGEPPALVGPGTLAPPVARRGATLSLVLQVQGALARPPEVRLELEPPRPFALDAANSTGDTWAFTYPVAGDEPQGRDVPVSASLVDTAGNAAGPLVAHTARFDFVNPSLVGTPRVEGSPVKAGAKAVVRFHVSEALGTSPVVTVLGSGAALTLESSSGLDYAYAYAVPAAGAVDDTLTVLATLQDLAGNTSADEPLGTVRVDVTAPSLAPDAGPLLTPGRATLGTFVQLGLDVTEPLPHAPAVRFGDQLVSDAVGAGRSWQYTWQVPADGGVHEGALAGRATLRDEAGNEATVDVGTLVIDTTPPSVTVATVNTPAPIAGLDPLLPVAVEGTLLDFWFTVSEGLARPPSVRLGAVGVAGCTATGLSWHCTHAVHAATDPEGLRQVYVDLVDVAGNAGTAAPLTVRLDYSAPQVAGASLLRTPGLVTARDDGLRVLRFSARDPATDEPVHAQVQVYGSEPLAAGAQLTATLDAGAGLTPVRVRFDGGVVGGSLAVFDYQLDGTEPAGRWDLAVTWSDLPGNGGTRTVPTDLALLIDPTVPPAIDGTRALYQREPWGSLASGGSERYAVTGSAGAATGATQVYALRDPTYSAPGHVGTATVQADGSFSMPMLGGGDRMLIYLQGVSAAGVRGPTAPADVEWVASLGRKARANILPNPHRAQAFADFGRWRFDPWTPETTAVATTTGGGGRWSRAATLDPHPVVAAMAFHGASAYTVALPAAGTLSDTLGFDGTRWRTLPVADPEGDGNPTHDTYNSGATALVEDPHRQVVVAMDMHGTWEWNGSSWALKAARGKAGVPYPSGILFAQLAFDAARGVVVLFGGDTALSDYTTARAETWEWDGATWAQRSFAGAEGTAWPGRRFMGGFEMDRRRNVLVLTGGRYNMCNTVGCACVAPTTAGSGTTCNYADTWEYDGTAWTKVTITDAAGDGNPTPGALHLVWDEAAGVPLAYEVGGTTWAYGPGSWNKLPLTDVENDGNPPTTGTGQCAGPMTYDRARSRLLLECGFSSFPATLTTWERVGTGWLRVAPAAVPGDPSPQSWRFGTSIVYDPNRHRMVMFGGRNGTSCDGNATANGDCNGVWEWTGGRWVRNTAAGPDGRWYHAAAWSGATGTRGMLVFGGRVSNGAPAVCAAFGLCGDTWVWDGAVWDRRCDGNDACTTQPPARASAAMAYDSVRQTVVLFGGSANGTALSDTWEWSGTNWAKVNTAVGAVTPPALEGPAMAYDPVRRRTVLYGGRSLTTGLSQADTWEWDGLVWRKMAPTTSPPATFAHSMYWDSTVNRVVTFGGYLPSSPDYSMDGWLYDGVTWTQAQRLGVDRGDPRPSPRVYTGLAFDTAQGSAFLFGGIALGAPTDEGWKLDLGTQLRPGEAFGAWSAAAGLTPAEVVSDVRVRFTTGARAFGATCTATAGAELLAWWDGAWRSLGASHTADATAPAALSWRASTDPNWSTLAPWQLHQRLLSAVDGFTAFAVRPRVASGCTPAAASLVTADPELTLRYRHY